MVTNQTLVSLLRQSKRILVFTGAGISTNSGIQDYRGPSGLWKTKQPVMYQDFLQLEEARFEYWNQKLEVYAEFRAAKPNACHQAIVDLQNANKLDLLATQNIDGLDRKAGIDPDKLVELHGAFDRVECQTCGQAAEVDLSFQTFQRSQQSPRCTCGGPLKPATISFGQSLVTQDLERAILSASECDLVVALGSSLTVYPAAEIPLIAAKRGVPYVIINRGVTEHDSHPLVAMRLEGDVLDHFPQAVAQALE